MILATSFLEAPLKFQAPGVGLFIGLGIGRIVFMALKIAELTLATVAAGALLSTTVDGRADVAFGATALALAAQLASHRPAFLEPAHHRRAAWFGALLLKTHLACIGSRSRRDPPDLHRRPSRPWVEAARQVRTTIDQKRSFPMHPREYELDKRPNDVLVISSSLAFGSVGLNAATRVYDNCGFRSLGVPTVLLSNLPHYDLFHQVSLGPSWLEATLNALTRIGAIDHVRTVVTGYLSSASQAEAIAQWYGGLSTAHQERMPLVVDPSFGDDDVGFYTDPAVATGLREHLMPLATGATPNLFELMYLTGGAHLRANEDDRIISAARCLLAPKSVWVVTTGLRASVDLDRSEPGISNLVVTPNLEVAWNHKRLLSLAKGVGDSFTAALVCQLLQGKHIQSATYEAGVMTENLLLASGIHPRAPDEKKG